MDNWQTVPICGTDLATTILTAYAPIKRAYIRSRPSLSPLSLMYSVRLFRGAERGWQECRPRPYEAACRLRDTIKRTHPLNPVRLVCLSPELFPL